MAATIGKTEYLSTLEVGEHTSTMGGNPIACAAGSAVLESLYDDGVVDKARISGENLQKELLEQVGNSKIVREIRGKGLMIALELKVRFYDILFKAVESGLITSYSGKTVLRLLPPLIIDQEDITKGTSILRESLNWYENQHI